MIGAIIGDLVGSVYEFNENKQNYDFPLVSKDSRITDDSCMSMAIAKAFCDCKEVVNLLRKEYLGSSYTLPNDNPPKNCS